MSLRPNHLRAPLALLVLAVTLFASSLAGAVSPGQRQSLESALEDQILDALDWPGALVEISDLQVIGTLPAQGWDLRLRSGRLHGSVQAEIHPRGAHRSHDNVWLRAQVDVLVPVFRASERIEAGQALDHRADEEFETYGRLPRDAVTDLSQLQGRTARRALRPGELLTLGHFEAPRLVERNDLVTLIVRRGAATVSVRGQALQAARLGDSVRVKNLSSDQIVVGVATAHQTVEIP